MSTPSTPRAKSAACSYCGRPVTPQHRPFCSRGCRDRDLLAWLGDAYRIPGPPAEEDDERASDGLDSGADRPL